MDTVIKLGSDVNLDDFIALLRRREQLIMDGLRDRVAAAHTLCSHYVGDTLTGIAAIKHPVGTYRSGIIEKCGADLPELEIGWFYVEECFRVQGTGKRMMQALMPVTCFATTMTGNVPMERILSASGFTRVGRPYSGSQGDYTIGVWQFIA